MRKDGSHNSRRARNTPEGELAYKILTDPDAGPADLQLAEKKGKYEVVIGKRRWNSAKAKHIQPIDISVRPTMTDLEALAATLENEFHKKVSDYEKGKTYKATLENFPDQFPTQQAVADFYSVDRSEVTHCISLVEFIQTNRKNVGAPTMPNGIEQLPERMVRTI